MNSSIKKSLSGGQLFPLLPSPTASSLIQTMRRFKPLSTNPFLIFLCFLLSAFFTLHLSRTAISLSQKHRLVGRLHPQNLIPQRLKVDLEPHFYNHVTRQDITCRSFSSHDDDDDHVSSVSILLPNWEVLVLVVDVNKHLFSSGGDRESFYCLFPNNETSPANFTGVLPFSNATAFKCILPKSNHRRQPFHQPVLTRSPDKKQTVTMSSASAPVMLRWDFLVYEAFSTESDVVLFVKGVNNRQGVNKSPEEFSCVFGNDINNAVRTIVTSSVQEVFRCYHPNPTALNITAGRIKVSLEINSETLLIPSVAYYTLPTTKPRRTLANPKPKSQLCATTMVYNVAKFLREWITYYSTIGVDKFILYDNGSDDDLERAIKELNEDYNNRIERVLWIWPKTQEAGFSHSAVYAKTTCEWMMYVDVDEFIFSPNWLQNSTRPSKSLLKSLLLLQPSNDNRQIGQVSIKCHDFGPSGQKEHPTVGVIQGYNCRRRVEQRHKSVVLLDAVDRTLLNVIHHFELETSYNYSWKDLPLDVAAVNHYKYQAWPEFMTKFRRRVSAFVADWKTGVNPKSKDRTPGLGFEPIKPERWENMFCDVVDERLKELTQRWFGLKMAWQR